MLYIKKKQIQNGEYEFLKEFLTSGFIDKINRNPKYELSIIHEPYTGFGYADLVCVIWDKKIKEFWNEERKKLDKNDIKVLHHMYNMKTFHKVDVLVSQLGYNHREITNSLKRLLTADLIKVNNTSKVKIKPINEIFYIKDIISIEAKLHNWKKALEQSVNNTYFSSKSYTLFPEKTLNSNLLKNYENTNVGIISFDKKYKIIKKPNRQVIPSTLNSWFFNEYIGRKVCRV